MKNFIILAAVIATLSNPAFAATAKNKATAPTTTTSVRTYSSSASSSREEILLSSDFGFGSILQKFHFGGTFHAEFPYLLSGNRFRFGGLTGFYLGTSNVTTWVVPLMLTATLDFPVSRGMLKPFVGVGMGASLSRVSLPTGSDTKAHFAIQINPGVTFGDRSNYYFQIPFGSMGSDFFVLPAAGLRF